MAKAGWERRGALGAFSGRKPVSTKVERDCLPGRGRAGAGRRHKGGVKSYVGRRKVEGGCTDGYYRFYLFIFFKPG